MSTGQNIVDEVRAQINDEDTNNLRWSDAEMLRYVNAGQRQIVHFVPESNIRTDIVSVSSDSDARRTIPAGGIKFIRASSLDSINELPDDSGVMREVELDAMDTLFPEWQYTQVEQPRVPRPADFLGSGNSKFEHYMHDPREPKVFYIWPPPPTSGSIGGLGVTYVDLPSDLAALANTFALRDEYQNAMVIYVTYRCLRKDGRHGGGVTLRKSMWDDFRSALGLQIEATERVSPENPRNAPPTGDGQ